MTNIRPADVWDVPAVTALWVEMMEELNPPFHRCDEEETKKFWMFASMSVASPQNFCLVVQNADGAVVGFAIGGIRQYMYGLPAVGACDWMYLRKGERTLKMFNDLVDAATQWGTGQGMPLTEIQVPVEKIKVYERMGYHSIGVRMMKGQGDG